ncbi:MAG: N,N-dimethylformamidase beta subunit family domain-containing protein [Pseudomonadota bacterium]
MAVDTNIVLGYPDRLSVAAGSRLTFHLSSKHPKIAASMVRLRCADVDPSGPGLRYTVMEPAFDPVIDCPDQPVRPGSCVIVEAGGFALPRGFAVGTYAWPTLPAAGEQVLMARFDRARHQGWKLVIGGQGLTLVLADGTQTARHTLACPVEARAWAWFAAEIDLEAGTATLEACRLSDHVRRERAVSETFRLPALGGLESAIPITLAAECEGDHYASHFNGKLEDPRIVDGTLGLSALRTAEPFGEAGIAPPGVLAFWDFSVGITTTTVTDRSPSRLDGRLHQLPLRAMTGRTWSGNTHDWRVAPREYAAIHFHSDDIVDCGWDPVLSFDIPSHWRSGFYALRLRLSEDTDVAREAVERESFISVFVTPAADAPKADLVVIAPTVTYIAYANSALRIDHVHFELLTEALLLWTADERHLQENPEIGQSTYDRHLDGSGRAFSSALRPILNMRPRANPMHFVTDSHLLDFLEEKGIAYDLITDMELHRSGPRALKDYRAAITLSHPEYYSSAMMNALLGFQNAGGRHLCLGANAFYWRGAMHPEHPSVFEIRRGHQGTRTWESAPGEVNLQSTGEPSGLWRHSGFAPQKLVGAGFAAMVYDRPGWYELAEGASDPRAAFIVDGLDPDGRIGDFGVRIGGAVGIEVDRADADLGTPAHALRIATSHGLGPGSLPSPEEFRTVVHNMGGEDNALVRADIMFFETEGGGAVLTTGSISYVLSLSHNGYDNPVSRLTENVIRRFIDPTPFVMPEGEGS